MPVRNTTAYSRSPLAQPSAAATESSCGVSRFMTRPSLRNPTRRPLVEERLHAFLALVAGADVGDAARRVIAQAGVDGSAGDVLNQLLAGAHGHRPVGRDRARQVGDLGIELVQHA